MRIQNFRRLLLHAGRAAALAVYVASSSAFAALTIDSGTFPDGMAGVPYSHRIAISGAVGSVECYIASVDLPMGINVGPSACEVSGEPVFSGTYAMTVVAKTATQSATRSITWIIKPGIRLTYSPPQGKVGTAYSLTPSRTGGTAPYNYSLFSGTLPPGLQVNSTSGVISGTPITGGWYRVQVKVVDSAGLMGVGTADIEILGPAMKINPPPGDLPGGKVGAIYTIQFTASGGTAPYSYTAPEICSGMTMASTGLFSGRPTNSGLCPLTVNVSDARGNTLSGNMYGFIVAPGASLSPAYGRLADGQTGANYSATVTASGMGAGLAVAASGNLPAGLSVSLSGTAAVIQGKPTQAGIYEFTLTFTDSAGMAVSGVYNMRVIGVSPTPLKIETTAMPDAAVGVPYSFKFIVSGGTPPYTFSQPIMLAGLSFDTTTGVLSGTPTVARNVIFSVTVTDAALGRAESYYPFSITSPALKLTYTAPPAGFAGFTYPGWNFTVSDGTPPYTVQIGSGALPPGLTMGTGWGSYTYAVTGTPTQTGTYSFRVDATDSLGKKGTAELSIAVRAPTLTISPPALPPCYVNVACTVAFSASGGTPPYVFQQLGGAIHVQMTDGVMTDLFGAPGSFPLIIGVTDSRGEKGVQNYTLLVAPGGLTVTASLPQMVLGQTYQGQAAASGGTPPYQFFVHSGGLPPGLSISTSGLITGVPTAAGPAQFTLRAQDSTGRTGTALFNVSVQGAPLQISPSSLPDVISGQQYSTQLSASGGVAPYTFTLMQADLWPQGLSLSANGLLSGSVVTQSDYSIALIVSVVDARGAGGTRNYALAVRGSAGFQMAPSGLPGGTVGVRYFSRISAAGGTPPYAFSIVSGALPSGVNLIEDGAVAGTPDRAGTYSVTIQVTDAARATISRQYSVAISGAPTLTISPPSLAPGERGKPYSVAFSASGGTPPYRFLGLDGAFPVGFSLSQGGLLTGTPPTAGVYRFSIRVTDAGGVTADASYTLQIDSPTLSVLPAALPAGQRGKAYSVSFSAAGGTAPYSFSLASGALPAGLSLTPQGLLAGTPANASAASFGIRVTDGTGLTGEAAYNLVIGDTQIEIAPATLPAGQVGAAYSAELRCSGAAAGCTFTITGGALPKGLTLGSQGQLVGTPAESGVFGFMVQARNEAGGAGSASYQLKVAGVEIQPSSLPVFAPGQSVSVQLSSAPSLAGAAFRLASGVLPPDVHLSTSGLISGAAPALGRYAFEVEIVWNGGSAGRRTYDFTLSDPLRLVTSELPSALQGAFYQTKLQAAGGRPPYRFTLESQPAAGLRLQQAGSLTGIAPPAGEYRLQFTVSDAGGASVSRALVLKVETQAIAIETTWLPPASTGAAYRFQFAAAGGTPPYRWTVNRGAVPEGLVLDAGGLLAGRATASGEFSFTAGVTDAAGLRAEMALTLHVQSTPGQWFVHPSELVFRAEEGSQTSLVQCVALFASSGNAQVKASLSLSGYSWASLTSAQTSAPGRLCVTADPSRLAEGRWPGELVLESAGSLPALLRVPVELAVAARPRARLVVAPRRLTVLAQASHPAGSTHLLISNGGGAQLEATLVCPAAWLACPSTPLAVEAGSARSVDILYDASRLTAGLHESAISVQAGEDIIEVPVELIAGASPRQLLSDRSTLTFIAWQGGAASAAQSVALRNAGIEEVQPSLDGGASSLPAWLSAGGLPASLPSGTALDVAFTASPGELQPGVYRTTVRITGAAVPVEVNIVFHVLPAEEAAPGATARTSLLAVRQAAESETRLATTLAGPAGRMGPVQIVLTSTGTPGWLTIEPGTPEADRSGTVRFTLRVDWQRLGAEISASAQLAAGFADGSSEQIQVTALNRVAQAPAAHRAAASDGALTVHILDPGPEFRLVADRPLLVRAVVLDREGTPATSAQVIARLGDASTALSHSGGGVFSGSLRVPGPGEAQLLVLAAGALSGPGSSTLHGRIRGEEISQPALSRVITGAGMPGPAVPGSWLILEGRNLISGEIYDGDAPERLGGLRVTLAGLPLRLSYVSPGRIDALTPEGLPAGAEATLMLHSLEGASEPLPVVIAPAHPRIYSLDGTGAGPALALDQDRGLNISPGSPALPGNRIRLFLFGLGPSLPCSVRVAGLPAADVKVVRDPGRPGFSEVSFVLPALPEGTTEAALQVEQGTLVSNRVTLAVAAN